MTRETGSEDLSSAECGKCVPSLLTGLERARGERRDRSSAPHLRILSEMMATMIAIKMMRTIRRMGRSAPFFFESFRELGEVLGCVEIDRCTRHLYSKQAISIAFKECTGALVASELRKLREVDIRE